MTVAVVEPDRTLALRATADAELPSGRSFDPRSAQFPPVYLDGILGLYLRSGPGGKPRLVAHTHGRNRPQLLMGAFSLLLAEPSHFIMETRQFHRLRTRVGAQA